MTTFSYLFLSCAVLMVLQISLLRKDVADLDAKRGGEQVDDNISAAHLIPQTSALLQVVHKSHQAMLSNEIALKEAKTELTTLRERFKVIAVHSYLVRGLMHGIPN